MRATDGPSADELPWATEKKTWDPATGGCLHNLTRPGKRLHNGDMVDVFCGYPLVDFNGGLMGFNGSYPAW